MKLRLIITLVISIGTLHVCAQQTYKPAVVVLVPSRLQYDTVFAKEVSEAEFIGRPSAADRKEFLEGLKGKEKNIQQMELAEFEYRKKGNFASQFSLGLYGMITYRIFGETEKCLILPSHDKSGSKPDDLKKIANKHKVNWVVNPVELSSYLQDGKKFSKLKFVLYDLSRNKIVIDKEYVGESRSPGFELSCESGSLECTINNLIGFVTHDVVMAILGGYQH
jgi:hypothetical protein